MEPWLPQATQPVHVPTDIAAYRGSTTPLGGWAKAIQVPCSSFAKDSGNAYGAARRESSCAIYSVAANCSTPSVRSGSPMISAWEGSVSIGSGATSSGGIFLTEDTRI